MGGLWIGRGEGGYRQLSLTPSKSLFKGQCKDDTWTNPEQAHRPKPHTTVTCPDAKRRL